MAQGRVPSPDQDKNLLQSSTAYIEYHDDEMTRRCESSSLEEYSWLNFVCRPTWQHAVLSELLLALSDQYRTASRRSLSPSPSCLG